MTQIDRSEPTWENQLWHAEQLNTPEKRTELRKHASVSRDNRHRCENCFCCACLTVLEGYESIALEWNDPNNFMNPAND